VCRRRRQAGRRINSLFCRDVLRRNWASHTLPNLGCIWSWRRSALFRFFGKRGRGKGGGGCWNGGRSVVAERRRECLVVSSRGALTCAFGGGLVRRPHKGQISR